VGGELLPWKSLKKSLSKQPQYQFAMVKATKENGLL
jgi:hypothetical protein